MKRKMEYDRKRKAKLGGIVVRKGKAGNENKGR
jgi:hypothetical protein